MSRSYTGMGKIPDHYLFILLELHLQQEFNISHRERIGALGTGNGFQSMQTAGGALIKTPHRPSVTLKSRFLPIASVNYDVLWSMMSNGTSLTI